MSPRETPRPAALWPFLLPLLLASACQLPDRDPAVPYFYDQDAVAVCNPDMGKIPLPNNLLNPMKLREIGVFVPGFDYPASAMELPAYDDEAVAAAASLGYTVDKDSDLTAFLKDRMNLLSGFYTGFSVNIPFNAALDMSSLTPFKADDSGDNVDIATFFFLDITDTAAPLAIDPAEYYLLFNPTLRDAPPYDLVLKNRPKSSILPENFTAGHTYLVVLTSTKVLPVSDTAGRRVKPDAAYLLMAGKTPYIGPDGASRFNLFSDLDRIRELERARQATDWGLTLWESFTRGRRHRGETVAAFHFTMADNPTPLFMKPEDIPFLKNPLGPQKARGLRYNCQGDTLAACKDTGVEFLPSFAVQGELDPSSATADTVGLFKVAENGSLSRVEAAVTVENAGGIATVRLTPAALEDTATYAVAATTGLKSPGGRAAASQVYHSLMQSPLPLVAEGLWQSPFLDSRADTLVSTGRYEHTTAEDLAYATGVLVNALTLMDALRREQQPLLLALAAAGFVQETAQVVQSYTFTTGGCPDQADPACDISCQDPGAPDLAQADLTGTFHLAGVVSTPLSPDPIEVAFIAILTQQGGITGGSATLEGELRSAATPAKPGVTFDAPAAIDAEGRFTATVTDFILPKDFSDMLAGDARSDITMEGRVINGDALEGDLEVALKKAPIEGLGEIDVTLSGTFCGRRQELP